MVEVLISVVLTGTAMAAIIGALGGATLTAQQHNRNVLLEASMSHAKQVLENAPYSATYTPPTLPSVTVTYSTPAPVGSVSSLQAITIEVAADGRTRSTVVYKTDR